MMEQIIIFDTTLRDGEQSPGASMSLNEKIKIAETLDAMGVNVIEAGFPAASDGDFAAVEAVGKVLTQATLCALARAHTRDITLAGEAIAKGKRGRIHTFLATSPLHMKYKLQMEPNQVLDRISEAVTLARTFTTDVEFSTEDGSRSEHAFLCQAIERAIEAGATTINIPDTVGYTIPEEYAALITMIKKSVKGIDKVVLSVHCHNDLGLGVANSLAAVKAGARQIECTINGLGERAGNAAMEEIVMAMKTRRDLFPFTTTIKTEHIIKASRLVSAVTGFVVQPNKAIVGANAFAHESGIHQDGMLKNAQTYEIMTPESVGLSRSSLVMGKHSGRHALRDKLKRLGIALSEEQVDDVFVRFKTLADKKKHIYDEDLLALVDSDLAGQDGRVQLVSVRVESGSGITPTADITLSIDGQTKQAKAGGSGPVDAIFNAIKECIPHNVELQLFQIHAVTQGTDAQAEVSVRLSEQGKTSQGHAADTDTLVAAAAAYIQALNKVFVKRGRHGLEQQMA
jgi:2-isopropylmalate synthase